MQGKAVPNGPKLEIKTDTKGTPVLEATEGLHGAERTKSCNLSPLTPKCASYLLDFSSPSGCRREDAACHCA